MCVCVCVCVCVVTQPTAGNCELTITGVRPPFSTENRLSEIVVRSAPMMAHVRVSAGIRSINYAIRIQLRILI